MTLTSKVTVIVLIEVTVILKIMVTFFQKGGIHLTKNRSSSFNRGLLSCLQSRCRSQTNFFRKGELRVLPSPNRQVLRPIKAHTSCFLSHAKSFSLSLIHISEPTRLGMISYASPRD